MMTNFRYIQVLFLSLIALTVYASSMDINQISTFNIIVTSDKPEFFSGSIFTDEGLMEIHKQTPYKISLKTSEIRLMLSAKQKKSMIAVNLTKNDNRTTKQLMNAKGRSIIMCSSNNTYDGINGCETRVRTGG